MATALQNFIYDLRDKQNEAQEEGELETILDITMRLGDMEDLLNNKCEVKWLECGLCHGSGTHKDYEDTWECPACLGLGGNFNKK
jgi:hypothetical protein